MSDEDVGFQKATPSGSADFLVDNPKATERLVMYRHYYIDFHYVPARAPNEPPPQ